MGRIQEMKGFAILIPTESDIISAYNLQTVFRLDPFDSIYFAIARNKADYLITRDADFIEIVNSAEKRDFAINPEKFVEFVEKNLSKILNISFDNLFPKFCIKLSEGKEVLLAVIPVRPGRHLQLTEPPPIYEREKNKI